MKLMMITMVRPKPAKQSKAIYCPLICRFHKFILQKNLGFLPVFCHNCTMRPAPTNLQKWVDEHGDMLYAYVYKTVGRSDTVDNLLQETFLAALQLWGRFEGRLSELTCLCGILRDTILQYLKNKFNSCPNGWTSLSFNHREKVTVFC